jgi:serine/threonine protein kinase/Tol biopolymer transport system component
VTNQDDLHRNRRARELFEALRDVPRADRAAALTAACSDETLQVEVSRLLAAADDAGSFLEHGAAAALAPHASLVGRTVGPYEISAVLGVGGMGEVYRARDTILRREVALKILPAPFGTDPERLARFRREAQILASLNHPNIAALYGLDESHGLAMLVMELVEGPTLADRLVTGAIPQDEAVPLACQIADALSAAHARGVVHRDLKPANVKLRPDGTVKVLDFGLAKSTEATPAGVDANLTHVGMILGTARCMSPEQARGHEVDKRSDIWAFGCVLFEMLCGKPAFEAGNVAETLAAILTREPDWHRLPPETLASTRRVLRRCLEKDRARRLADIADARLELTTSDVEEPAPREGTSRRLILWVMAAAGIALATWFVVEKRPDAPIERASVYRSSIVLPERLGSQRNVYGNTLALSPDGKRLAFVASDASGKTRLWIRALDDLDARSIPDTADAQSPFWSPDGRSLAFVQDRHLRKVDVASGAIVTLCDEAMFGGAWSRAGVILFTQLAGNLASVPETGGTATPLATIANNAGEVFNTQPFFLDDPRAFGYVSLGVGNVHTEVYVASLDSESVHRLPIEASVVQYTGGHLWFMSGSTLMAQAFDAGSGAVRGLALPVAEKVRINSGPFRGGVFSVSPAGTLVYQRDPAPGYELVWYDRSGKLLGTLGAPADYGDVALSPDGSRALVSIAPASTGVRDLWIFDLARGLRTQFTFDDSHSIRTPIWSPDGRKIAFATERQGHIVLMLKDADGGNEPTILLDDPFDKEPLSWSPDGRFMLYAKRSQIATPEVWVLPLDGGTKPYLLPYARSRFAWFAPDGRWIALVLAESTRGQLYVAPFPGPGALRQVSSIGGVNARWRADGKEIIFVSPRDNKLMSAEVSLGRDRAEVGAVRPLFDFAWLGPRNTHDLTPDGERILALVQLSPGTSAPLTLVVNWQSLLEKQ